MIHLKRQMGRYPFQVGRTIDKKEIPEFWQEEVKFLIPREINKLGKKREFPS